MTTENNFFDITTDNRNGWDDKFKTDDDIKKFIFEIYTKYDDKYSTLLDTNDKIIINNIEQLSDINVNKGRGILIYICSFTYIENTKYHTSIVISTLNRTFIIHNYDTNEPNNNNNKRSLFVFDEEKFKVDNKHGPKLNEPIYFFLEDNGKCSFSYEDNLFGGGLPLVNKHINFIGNTITNILDYNAPITSQPFINNMVADPMLLNSYLYDKYIGYFAINNTNLNVYNHINPDPYILITKDTNNFQYTINNPKNKQATEFTLSYKENNGKPELNITVEFTRLPSISYNITENIIVKTDQNTSTVEFQRYSISQKYIPLYNNSTYISALITFIMKVNGLTSAGNPLDSMVSLIKNKPSIYDFTLSDIKKLCNNVNSILSGITDCSSEINLMNIIINIVNNNVNLFNFNVVESSYINNGGNIYNIYEKNGDNPLKKMINANVINTYLITVTPDMEEVDINKYLNIPGKLSVTKQPNVEYYYYLDNDEKKQTVKVEDEEIKNLVILTDIKKYFLVTLELFDKDSGNVKNTKIKLKNMFNALNFKNKILMPTFMVFFVGNSLSTGYYITIQHYNNNWYVYDHKNRTISNYVDEYYFNESNTFPFIILYKSFEGTKETIYNRLANDILKDDFNSNDDTINYYLNPQYELIKYKENYIYNNYDLEEVINSLNDTNHKYKINDDEELLATEFFYGLNNDLNEITVLNSHTSTFLDNYIENNFDINKIKSEMINNLF